MGTLKDRFIDNYLSKLKLLYPERDEKELLKVITRSVNDRYTPLEGHLYDNYENTDIDLTTEEIIDKIEKENIITSGRGILFKQHDGNLNPSLMILQDIQKQRKNEKKLMFKAIEERNTEEEKYHDIRQKIYKLYMNSWFGVSLQKSSYFYNPHTGLSIMGKGRSIIANIAFAFESFMENNVKFENFEELLVFIDNIKSEKYELDDMIDEDRHIGKKKLVKYLKKQFHERFDIDSYEDLLIKAVDGLSKDERDKVYYKNNFYKFVQNSKPDSLIQAMCNNGLEFLAAEKKVPEGSNKEKEYLEFFEQIDTFWSYCKDWVFYNYPVYDRLKKIKKRTRKTVIVIDTDSNFVNLHNWVKYLKKKHYIDRHDESAQFRMINTMALLVTNIANDICWLYGKNSNVDEAHRPILNFKNEFYYSRIVLSVNKKQYVGRVKIKEGKILPPTKEPDIKGFMFKKSSFNKDIGEIMKDIIKDDILDCKKIDVLQVNKRMKELESFIRDSISNGEKKFWRPSKVNTPESYKDPMTQAPYKAVMLFNKIYPKQALGFPAQISLIKLKAKGLEDFKFMKEEFPEEYENIKNEVFNSPLWDKGFEIFALPRNEDNVPKWIIPLIDIETIVMDSLKPILPVLNSIGLKTINTTSDHEFNSQMVYFK